MGVIKSAQAPASAVPFSMKDIENQARGILLRARQQADQLLAAAQAEAAELKKRASAEGLAAGRAEGLAQGRQEGIKAGREQALNEHRNQLSGLITALTHTAAELDRSRRQLEASAVKDVLDLAIAIAQRVTKLQGVLDPAVAVANVVEAMKIVGHASDVRLAIHPTQLAALTEVLPRLRREWPALEHVQLMEDAALAPGGCRVFTAQGQVDGDLDEQLRRIVADLLPGAEMMDANRV
jgi:flagellar assembly protein FliH